MDGIFGTSTMQYQKEKLGGKLHLLYNKKNKVLRNKFNQGGKRLVLRKLWNTEDRN